MQTNWAVLSDEQMSNGYPFSLVNDEQMSNKVGVKHQPAKDGLDPQVFGDIAQSIYIPRHPIGDPADT